MNNFYIVNSGKKINILTHKLDKPKAILVHLHGLHSHFQHVYPCQNDIEYRISYFNKIKVKSFALEFTSHGKSDGLKGYIENFDSLLSDLDKLLQYINQLYTNLPIFILGLSMGGTVSIKYLISNHKIKNIKGVILISPMCGVKENKKPSIYFQNFANMLCYFIPTARIISSHIDNTDNIFLKKYIKAEHQNKYSINTNIRLKTGIECYNALLWINSNKTKFDTSVLAIQSKEDKVTCHECTEDFISNCSSKDKEFVLLEKGNHNILIPLDDSDYSPDVILFKIINWINNRI